MTSRILFSVAMIGALASPVQALEGLPKRKPGLWEIQNEFQGRSMGIGPIQTCADEKTDNLVQQHADEAKQKCSVMEWKKDGDRITINSICKIMETTTATTTAVFSGNLDSNYRGEVHVAYDPPIHGKAEMNMTISAKWLGPCKEGQKAGDIALPNLGQGKNAPNLQELMKMRDQMKAMQK